MRFLVIIILTLFSQFAMAQKWPARSFQKTDSLETTMQNIMHSPLAVLVFISVDCPFDNYYLNRLEMFSVENPEVDLVLINSNSNEISDIETITSWIKENNLKFPMILDSDNTLANLLKIRKSSHCVLIKNKGTQFQVLYNGAFDNNPQIESQVSKYYLKDALIQAQEGKPIETPYVQPMGCMIR
ncbi:MAG: redoxin domain-containing protein [Cyclobacteriaceae bacterium]|nr:redoxin domain-containing protein [Cyclobacteriaceae bacterium]